MTDALAIIDPFSSGLAYEAAARAMGIEPITVHSYRAPDDAPLRAFQGPGATREVVEIVDHEQVLTAATPAAFRRAGQQIGNRLRVVCRERGLRLRGVVAGSELGVPVADSAAAYLGLPGNDPAYSVSCRHKGRMKDVARAGAIQCAAYAEVRSAQQLDQFLAAHPGFPMFLKPPHGGGSTAVRKCRNSDEAHRNLAELIRAGDFFGFRVGYVLAETFLPGLEYAANLFCNGPGEEPTVTDIWEYARLDTEAKLGWATNVYHTLVTLDRAHHRWTALAAAARRVAHAFGRRYGPLHIEMKHDGRGVALVEIGARLAGGGLPTLLKAITGWDVIAASVAVCTGHEAAPFVQRCPESHAGIAFCATTMGGRVRQLVGLDEIAALPTVINGEDVLSTVRLIGTTVVPTVDTSTCPLMVKMVGERAAVRNDARKVHALFNLVVD